MSRPSTAALLVVLLGCAAAVMAGTGAEAPVVPADRELLARVMTETGAERSLPAPSWSAYLVDLTRAIAGALGRGARPLLDWLRSRGAALEWLAWALLAALALALAFLLVRAAIGTRRRPATMVAETTLTAGAPAVATRGREAWRAEIEERLTAGDVSGALLALWWWLACSLAGRGVDPSWTTRELFERCGRPELSPLARALDRLMYGPGRTAPADVVQLLERLDAVLP